LFPNIHTKPPGRANGGSLIGCTGAAGGTVFSPCWMPVRLTHDEPFPTVAGGSGFITLSITASINGKVSISVTSSVEVL